MQTFTQTVLMTVTVVLSITVVVLLVRRRPTVDRRPTEPAVTHATLQGILRAAEPIADGGTVVRAVRQTDAAAVGAMIDDVVIHAMGWPRERIARDYTLLAASGGLAHCAIVVAEATGEPVGVVALEPTSQPATDDRLGLVNVGMWAGAAGRGHGHMGRAVPCVVALLIRHGIAVTAETAVANAASRRVLVRAGMRATATRSVVLPDGQQVASVVYGRSPVG